MSKYDENWHTTEIQLDLDCFDETETDWLKHTLTHELSHALKLSNTYCTIGKIYDTYTASYLWFENTEETTIMDQGWRADWQITQMDEDRLNYKWDNFLY